MATTAGDVLVETLVDWGVDTVFGLPGDGINGIMEALRTRQDRIRFVQVRHEEAAAFMACGYAKCTGRLGVCLATSGPGGIHLLNGLYDAKLDGAPVLAITGLQYHDLIGTHTQQDVELDKLFIDVAVYNARIMGPAHVENVVDLACRTALACRGVAHVTMPVDMQSMPVERRPRSKRNVPGHVSDVMAASAQAARRGRSCARAAAILNAGSKIVHPGRAGARSARGSELEQVAERLGAPIVKALLGKAARARRQPLHHRRRRPARHRALAGRARGLRHAADRRQHLPLHRVLPEARAGAGGADRPRSRRGSACATRSRSASSATAGARCEALLPRLERKADRSLPRAGAGRAWRTGAS